MSRFGDQAVGYDKTTSMFSPDGRIIQLEYARVAMRRGLLTIAIVTKEAVILGGLIPLSKLLLPAEKIYQIDDHIAAAYAGYTADGRVLINKARDIAYQNRLIFGEEIDVYTLAEELSDYMQQYTQYGGVRPFGVGIFIGGYDIYGPRAVFVDPGGTIFGIRAYCVGRDDEKVIKLLKERYDPEISYDDALKLAVEGLVLAMKEEDKRKEKKKTEYESGVSHERVLIVRIDKEGVKRIPEDDIKKIIESLGGDSE